MASSVVGLLALINKADEIIAAGKAQVRRFEEYDRLLMEGSVLQKEEEEEEEEEDEEDEEMYLEERFRSTSLAEYVVACHHKISSNLFIPPSPKSPSYLPFNGSRMFPTELRAWDDFLSLQRLTFGQLLDMFAKEKRYFPIPDAIESIGSMYGACPIEDVNDLEYHLTAARDAPIKSILSSLSEIPGSNNVFNIGKGASFERELHDNGQGDWIGDGTHAMGLPPTQAFTRNSTEAGRPPSVVLIPEHKAPNELTLPILRAGLRPMKVWDEVIDPAITPPKKDDLDIFTYNADRLVVSALAEAYQHMIHGGLEYGLVTTGQAIVFLKVDWNDAHALHYHFAEPVYEVAEHPTQEAICSFVGQQLAFLLLAMGPPGGLQTPTQDQRHKIIATSGQWKHDFETVLRTIPDNQRNMLSNPNLYSTLYPPTTYCDQDRTPLSSRKANRKKKLPAPTPSALSAACHGDYNITTTTTTTRHYCSHKCLLGLVRGHDLDPDCPKFRAHCDDRLYSASKRHLITYKSFLRLLGAQLHQTLDEGIVDLGILGSRGAVFQVTLLSHGYTFIGKGVVQACVSHLDEEAQTYACLEPIQGTNVPVFLGKMSLTDDPISRVYYYNCGIPLTSMMFLSYGGPCYLRLDKNPTIRQRDQIKEKALAALDKIHECGVAQRDACERNVVVDGAGQVMIIDFERAMRVRMVDGRVAEEASAPLYREFERSVELDKTSIKTCFS